MAPWLSLGLVVLGIAVLFLGNRLWLLGAGIGALLGTSLVFLFPSILGGGLGVLTILGLAVTFAVLAVVLRIHTYHRLGDWFLCWRGNHHEPARYTLHLCRGLECFAGFLGRRGRCSGG